MTVAEMEAKAGHLMAAHWAEVEGDRAPLAINWQSYRVREEAGLVFIQGAYVGDAVVGYCVLSRVPHIHNVEARPARISAIYVDPTYRRQLIGMDLLRWAIRTAKQVECTEISGHARPGAIAGKILEAMGFEAREVTYVKEIGNGV